MGDLTRRIIDRCTPAFDRALEVVSSEDEDKMIGRIVRLSPDIENGDIEAVMEVLFINLINEELN